MEYNYCQGQALMLTLTYDQDSLPRTEDYHPVAVYREDDLKVLDFIKKHQDYEPEMIVLYEDESDDFKKDFLNMVRESKNKTQQTVLKRKFPEYNPGDNDNLDEIVELKTDWHMQQFEEKLLPTHIVYNQPGAPKFDYAQLRSFLNDSLKGKLRRAGIKEHVYYAVGEYGDKTGRAHFHVNLFFRQVDQKRSAKEWALLLTKKIKDSWPHGFADVVPAKPGAAMYLVEYLTEKNVGRIPTRSAIDDSFIRIDGSPQPADYFSKGKSKGSAGLGYKSIPTLAEKIKSAGHDFLKIPEHKRDRMFTVFSELNPPDLNHPDISKICAERYKIFADKEDWSIINLMHQVVNGQLVVQTQDGLKADTETLPMANGFRKELCRKIGVSEEAQRVLREHRQEMFEKLREETDPKLYARAIDQKRSKADLRKRKRRAVRQKRLMA